jgi:hypothetical protein
MSKRSVFSRQGTKCIALSCLLVISTFLFPPPAVLSQPAGQQSVKVEVVPEVPLGSTVEVSVNWTNDDSMFEVGGFDLLIWYDATVLTPLGVNTGQLLSDCAWEYFTYRVEVAYPHTIRLVAIADIYNGNIHPTCYGNSSGELAKLNFAVTDNLAYECIFVPIRFIWFDCGDNAFSSRTGESLFVSNDVYDYVGDNNYVQIDQDSPFPTYAGAPDNCVDTLSAGSPIIRTIDYYNGGVQIWCVDSNTSRGDINLNGIPYEVADYLLFVDYFVFGLQVFVIDPPAQIAAGDVNADGSPLTIDDLVYLWRVIIGDAIPFPRPPVLDEAVLFQDDFSKTVSLVSPDSLSAAFLFFRGNIVPTVLVPNVDIKYHFDGWFTSVIIYPYPIGQVPVFGPGPLMAYTGHGQLQGELVAGDGIQPIPAIHEVAWTINTKVEIEPDTMWAFWAHAIDPIMAVVYLGNIPDDSVLDVTNIQASTVRVNDNIVPESTQVLASWPGFNGSVMQITFSASEMVSGYLPFYDTTSHLYTVRGQLTDGTPFLTYGAVFLIGHKSGDVNLDGRVNVADLTFLVNYLFRQGDPPPEMQTADVNGDGNVNVADVTALVQLLFG